MDERLRHECSAGTRVSNDAFVEPDRGGNVTVEDFRSSRLPEDFVGSLREHQRSRIQQEQENEDCSGSHQSLKLTRNNEKSVSVDAKFPLSEHSLMEKAQSVSVAVARKVLNLPWSYFQKKHNRANIRELRLRKGILRDDNIHAGGFDLLAHA
jgi:hypothetical protein